MVPVEPHVHAWGVFEERGDRALRPQVAKKSRTHQTGRGLVEAVAEHGNDGLVGHLRQRFDRRAAHRKNFVVGGVMGQLHARRGVFVRPEDAACVFDLFWVLKGCDEALDLAWGVAGGGELHRLQMRKRGEERRQRVEGGTRRCCSAVRETKRGDGVSRELLQLRNERPKP